VCGTVQAGRTPALPAGHTCPERRYWAGTVWRAVPGGTGSSSAPRKLGVLRDAPRCCADPLRGRYAELEAVRRLIVPESVFERCQALDLRLPGSHEER